MDAVPQSVEVTDAREGSLRRRIRIAAVYIGAALGPLGGGVVAPMLPQVGQSLGVSANAVALSLTVYFVPFAAVQLVSGTLGERWGRRNTVLAAYLVYLIASLICAFAPDITVFLAMRGLQGVANAFTSPLLLAGLADMVPVARLSRSVGIFASCQAAGQSFAPLIGGVAAATSWRWGFVAVAAAAGLLALAPPPGAARPGAAAPRWRPLLSGRLALLSTGALVSYLGGSGLPFLVALYAEDHLRLRSDLTGLALLGFGLAGLLLGAVWGTLLDRASARWCGAAAAVVTAAFVASVGLTDSPWVLAACWTAAGAGSSMLNVALQYLTIRAVPANRGGALSAVSAFRFSGAALAPVVWLPFYHVHPAVAFAAAGSSLLVAAVALLALRGAVPAGPGRPRPGDESARGETPEVTATKKDG
ncbi:MFS transporter [Pseudonocardia sp. Cha107L01]|uniref:MFS transporter n=1 Tax=Pseudonocardia sp. Cha107L01 TaxID=3457576 RepID=UPI00403ED0BA